MAEKEFEVPESDHQTDTESEDNLQDPSSAQLDTEKEDQPQAQLQHQLKENDPKPGISNATMLSIGDKVSDAPCQPGYARDSKGVCRRIV